MLRQRLRARTPAVAVLGRPLLLIASAALAWYGLMVILLALKASPSTVNAISGYQDIYTYLAGLRPGDLDGWARLAAGLAGLVAFLVCATLAWSELPRPYLARTSVPLSEGPRGSLEAQPRAIERAAELAALSDPTVSEARARYEGSELTLDLESRQARDLPGMLRDAQAHAIASLRAHDLPPVPVNVTLTGYHRTTRRELA